MFNSYLERPLAGKQRLVCRLKFPPCQRTFFIPMSRTYRKAITVAAKTPGVCYYCGELHNGEFHLDHFIPECKGGSSEVSNLVPSCAECNERKGGRTIEQFRELIAVGVKFTDKQNDFLCRIGLGKDLYKIVNERLRSTFFWFEVRPDLSGEKFTFMK